MGTERLLAAVGRTLVAGFVCVVGAGIVAEILRFQSGKSALTDTLSLSFEGNVPTWYSSMLLFACALALAANGLRAEARWQPTWGCLSVVFVAMSMDEVASFHERLNAFGNIGGALTFAWIIPFGVLAFIVAVLCIPLLRSLPPATRAAFVFAGALYVSGALGMELVLGAWMSAHGADNLTWFLIDAVEEAAEIAGASLFLWSLLGRLWR